MDIKLKSYMEGAIFGLQLEPVLGRTRAVRYSPSARVGDYPTYTIMPLFHLASAAIPLWNTWPGTLHVWDNTLIISLRAL